MLSVGLSCSLVALLAACQPKTTDQKASGATPESATAAAPAAPQTPTAAAAGAAAMTSTASDPAADQKFHEYTQYAVPAGETAHFHLNTSYPTTAPPAVAGPWATIDFKTKPEPYLRAVLTYCLDGAQSKDFDFNGSTKWFHAPWLAREPLRGLTSERPSSPGELSKAQTGSVANYAVGYYNAPGGYAFGQVWADHGNPLPVKSQFPVGTVSCKLLFTTAKPAQVPYIADSLKWRIAPKGVATDARLLQLDVAVRDANATATGWVFGTFMFIGDATTAGKPFDFNKLTAASLMWGNDKDLGPKAVSLNPAAKPAQSWVNPKVTTLFTPIRTAPMTANLGLYGRANGPVDNPKSACLSCHGRALDGGPTWTSGVRAGKLPFFASKIDVAHDADVLKWYRDLSGSTPFLTGSQYVALDYSLQMAVGLENYHAWRIASAGPTPSAAGAAGGAAASIPWMKLVPDAEAPKRGP
jgi:hypothetical protein